MIGGRLVKRIASIVTATAILGACAATLTSSGLGASNEALGEPADSHVCRASAPPIEAMPAIASMSPSGRPRPEPPEQPPQMMGCLSRDYPLRTREAPGALAAIAIAEDPSSIAEIHVFSNAEVRDALVVEWLKPAQSSEEPMAMWIADWQHIAVAGKQRTVFGAMVPNQNSGRLCLVRANSAALRDALPVLNNWCMDLLKLWRE